MYMLTLLQHFTFMHEYENTLMHIITIIDDRFRMSYIDICAATSIYCEQVYWSGAIESEKAYIIGRL